eukprot:11204859-Lingulodinium_polyedra.AAC.1
MDCSAISRTRCTCLVIPTSVPVVSSAAAADSVSGGSIFGVRPYNAMQGVLPLTVSRQLPARTASAS